MLGIAKWLLAVAIFQTALVAWSADTSDPRHKQQLNNAEGSKPKSKNNEGSLGDNPISLTVTPTITRARETRSETQNEHHKTNWEALTAIATAVLALITAFLAFFTLKLWRSTSKLVRDSEAASKKQLRAYVHMTHVLPGLKFNGDSIGVSLHIKNYGKTPATVVAIELRLFHVPTGDLLPEEPDYSGGTQEVSEVFVGADHHFYHSGNIPIIPGTAGWAMENDAWTVYLYGYVEYIDTFGDRYRSGYGAQFVGRLEKRESYKSDAAFLERNNLIILTKRGYNYDRQIKNSDS